MKVLQNINKKGKNAVWSHVLVAQSREARNILNTELHTYET